MIKRIFDVTLSILALAITSPLIVVIAVGTALVDGLPVLFTQERIGRGFESFTLYKFRTMTVGNVGPQITSSGDPRITRMGHLLRATKLDELPQLLNVVRGDMSLVGPRPEVPQYVERFKDDFNVILSVRPGVTGAGSVAFRNESNILGSSDDPEQCYIEDVLPQKITLEIDYVENRSMLGDVRLLIETVGGLFS